MFTVDLTFTMLVSSSNRREHENTINYHYTRGALLKLLRKVELSIRVSSNVYSKAVRDRMSGRTGGARRDVRKTYWFSFFDLLRPKCYFLFRIYAFHTG